MIPGAFERSRALLGAAAMDRLAAARVILFGTGGVGSWCAEALVRTGFGHLVIVDDDTVAASNLNRQLPATARTLGRPKTEALRERLLEVNPAADVVARAERYTAETSAEFGLADFDYVIDAIDAVAEKAHLVRTVTELERPVLYSSMGAALRTDPTRVRVSPFEKVEGDGLARALRQRFRKEGAWPARRFLCVHSSEPPRNLPERGSIMPVTAAFGLALASLVVRSCSEACA